MDFNGRCFRSRRRVNLLASVERTRTRKRRVRFTACAIASFILAGCVPPSEAPVERISLHSCSVHARAGQNLGAPYVQVRPVGTSYAGCTSVRMWVTYRRPYPEATVCSVFPSLELTTPSDDAIVRTCGPAVDPEGWTEVRAEAVPGTGFLVFWFAHVELCAPSPSMPYDDCTAFRLDGGLPPT